MDERSSKAVVAGEASESDDEDIESAEVKEDVTAAASGQSGDSNMVVPGNTGAVVSGEASESEEEVDTSEGKIPPLNVNPSEVGDKGDITNTEPSTPPVVLSKEVKPKYNSLLNRKLRERNMALRRHIVDTVHQTYTVAAKDLHTLTLQLQKTQISIQDVSHHMRNTTNDLFHLEDRIDIVRSCNLLPDISLPTPATVAAAQS